MAKQSFEASLEKLERITRELEEGDLTLEDSLKKFEEGVRLAEFCRKKLDEAKEKVQILVKKNDILKTRPWEEAPPRDADDLD